MAGIWGNIVKLALGVISLVFDGIFFIQHYVMFAGSSSEYSPLLEGGEEDVEGGEGEQGGGGRGLYVTASGQLIHAASGNSVVIADESMWNNPVSSADGNDNSDEARLRQKHISTGSTSSTLWNQESHQACFGAGCFWGTQKFLSVDFGTKLFEECLMENGRVGYMGGASKAENIPFLLEEVASGEFGHVEVFQCSFMGGNDMFEEMVKFFFQFHDSTTKDKQSNDVGPQYASAIYCHSEDQYRIATKVKNRLQKLIDSGVITCFKEKEVTTRVLFAKDYAFIEADTKHQHYLQSHPGATCSHRVYFQHWQ
jgi:peptide-methionine (S)-S-oxide reductase